MARLRIGELLIEAKVISEAQLGQALAAKAKDDRKLGQILTDLGMVTETQLTQALGRQLSVPWVSLFHVDFSRQLLNLVPREIAEKYCLVPIFVRKVRKQGETLYVAMDDPTNEGALAEAATAASLAVRPMIACPSDIRSAIRVYYGGTAVAGEALRDGGPPPVAAQKDRPSEPQEPAALPAKDSPDAWPEVEAHTLDLPPRKGPKMVALTLLDGTTIRLPARGQKPPEAEGEGAAPGDLTARDLIRALRAVAQGQDASEILGEHVPLEATCAALLSVLLRKGLVADWEFVEELRKL